MYEVFNLLGLALISKLLTCVITFGIRTPTGIFMPTLLIGACFGRMLGIVIQHLTM
jgi:chloride channel 3/4/5